ncbi:MAG: hypothetical protein IJZ87_04645 [Bacteroidales bacterium]|nr:hypothetical protein [Bacteroidales bacterium]
MQLPIKLLEQELKRGAILHSNIFESIDHGKFFAIIGEDDNNVVGAFFVNSKINDFISTKPKLLELQYKLHCTIYKFLNYDSYLCCSDLIKIDKTSLAQSISKGKSTIKGNLIEEDLKNILNNVNKSKIFSEQEKNKFFK